jgi:hypothetical protein
MLLHNCFCTLCHSKSIVIFSLCSQQQLAAGSLYSLFINNQRAYMCITMPHMGAAVSLHMPTTGCPTVTDDRGMICAVVVVVMQQTPNNHYNTPTATQ